MPDLYLFPHISRMFYLESSPLHKIFAAVNFRQNFPGISRWYDALKNHPDFNLSTATKPEIIELKEKEEVPLYREPDLPPVIPASYFRLWLNDLVNWPNGTKPPLRYPFVFKDKKGIRRLAKL